MGGQITPPPGFTLDPHDWVTLPADAVDVPHPSDWVTLPPGYTLDQPHRRVLSDADVAAHDAANAPHVLTDADISAHDQSSALSSAVGNWWDQVNPVKQLQGIGDTIRALATHPRQTLTRIGSANDAPRAAAVDAFKRGDYVEGVRHGVNWLLNAIPGVGSTMEKASDEAQHGDLAGGIGTTLGIATNLALAKGLPKSVPLGPRVATDLTPEEASAVQFADKEGIPLSAATRTGSKAAANLQASVANAPGGAKIAKQAAANTREALAATGERLAGEAPAPYTPPSGYTLDPAPAAVPSTTPEAAGAGVASALGDLSQQQGRGATSAYTRLEQIENDPKNLQTMQNGSRTVQSGVLGPDGQPITSMVPITKQIALPVDMRSAKTALKPVLDRLEQEMPLAQQQASRGLQAIRNVIGQDDFVPASVADQNLSALKQLQREAVHPKTQFLANKAVSAVAPLVDDAVAQAGPEATNALNEGRALTKAKYATDATLDQLQTEPVRLFNQLTAQKDTAINLLRDVRSKAPSSMPAVGRAYLEGLLDSATSEGGKPGAGTAYSQWQKLGPQTKQILFPSEDARGELDNFFALAKKTAENPNPSGTAYVNGGRFIVEHPMTGIPYVINNNVLARLLFNPNKAKMLQTGLRMPLRSPGRAIVSSSILRAAGDGAKPIAMPMAAQNGQDQPVDVAAQR